MAAVSEGAHEVGGHVVGLPMSGWKDLEPNRWNAELEWAADYPTRLGSLLRCRAVVALDGGVGTLSELAVVWAAAQTEPDMPRIVAVGDRWRKILSVLGESLVIGSEDLALVRVVDSPGQVLAVIAEPSGGEATFGPRG
jgi:predicted Rossmann-fold nucleotide-binding protein